MAAAGRKWLTNFANEGDDEEWAREGFHYGRVKIRDGFYLGNFAGDDFGCVGLKLLSGENVSIIMINSNLFIGHFMFCRRIMTPTVRKT